MSDAAEARRKARASWPVRRTALSEHDDDVITGRSPSEQFAMVHELTLDAWAMSGKPVPDYRRDEAPGRLIRPSP